jgi:predicted DCC family thiol-disulfide oxidoreductase YuxK
MPIRPEHDYPVQDDSRQACLTVYHDGSCPLCAREIALYRRAEGAERLVFVDVSRLDAAPGDDLDRESAMRRFHVRDAEGRLVSGGRAFAALWLTLPGWRWLGRAFSGRLGGAALDLAYRAFLPVRPLVQKLVRRRA